jgi:hypothetical protein
VLGCCRVLGFRVFWISCDGPKGRINYPDGFVSTDKQWLHFAFNDNRHRYVHYNGKLPPQ